MKKPKLPKLSKKKIVFILGLVVILAGAGYLLVDKFYKGENSKGKVVFTIEDKSYYEKDLEPVLAFPVDHGTDKDKAAKEAFELYKKVHVAEKLGLEVSQEEIDIQKQDLLQYAEQEEGFDGNKYGAWFDLLARASAIEGSAQDGNPLIGYKGYAFDVFFGQHIQHGPTYSPEGLNDQSLIAADKEYAKERAEFYHSKLQNNEMTPDQVIEELKNDQRLNRFEVGDASMSVKFGYDPDMSWQEEIYYDATIDFISQQKESGLSDIQIGQASADSTPDNLTDMYYYFVLLEGVSNSKDISQKEYAAALKNLSASFEGF